MSALGAALCQRSFERLPREQAPARLSEVRFGQGVGGGVENDRYPVLTQEGDTTQERRVLRQRLVRIGDSDDRLSRSQSLVEQAQCERVADTVRPFVDRVEGGRGDHERIG